MSEIKVSLRNKTRVELKFHLGDDISSTIPALGSTTISVKSGTWLSVSSKGLVGDIWRYEITEDISLDCSLVGEELELRVGSPL